MILAVNTFPSLCSLLYHIYSNHFRKYIYFFIFGLVAQILAWCCAHSRDSRNIFFWETIKIISKYTYSFCWNFQHPFPYGFTWNRVFPCSTVVRNLPANAGDTALIPGIGRSTREENGNPLQYSCLENPMDRGAGQAIIQEVAKSQKWLGNWTTICSILFYHHSSVDTDITTFILGNYSWKKSVEHLVRVRYYFMPRVKTIWNGESNHCPTVLYRV